MAVKRTLTYLLRSAQEKLLFVYLLLLYKMPKTLGKMHMNDMVKINTILFKIVGGGGFKSPPPDR